MNGVSHPGYRFFVCEQHRKRLLAGERPVVVAARTDLAQLNGPLAVILE